MGSKLGSNSHLLPKRLGSNLATTRPECFLATFGVYERGPMPPCDGRLVRCHLLPRQLIKANCPPRLAEGAIEDPRSWVWGCGGPMGNGGHHGMFDSARTLRIPREALPPSAEALAADLGLLYWLDREYGLRSAA
jgi:hypothetical protein